MVKYFKKIDIEALKWLQTFLSHTESWSPIRKKLIGSLTFLAGVVFIITPGPGIVFMAAGATLISERFGIMIANLIQKYLKWRESHQK